MLKNRALKFYNEGFNCAKCILKACEEEYNIKISEDCHNSCNGLYNGLGIGSCCGVLLACIMIIGIMCDDVSYSRLEMIERFKCEFSSINCCIIKNKYCCEKIICVSCDILANIIDKDRKKH